jgi:hypothetical protein
MDARAVRRSRSALWSGIAAAVSVFEHLGERGSMLRRDRLLEASGS